MSSDLCRQTNSDNRSKRGLCRESSLTTIASFAFNDSSTSAILRSRQETLPEVFFFDEMHPAQVVLIGQLHTAGRWLFARVQEAVCAPPLLTPLLHPNLTSPVGRFLRLRVSRRRTAASSRLRCKGSLLV
jgi:hypothetical protein